MFNFFRNNNGRLIHYVKKTHNLPCGTFGNISDDLGVSINNDGFSPMVKMAYAYARRAVTAGLVYQGVFPVNQFIYVNGIFKSFQITTGHSVAFQEEAYEQAVELTLSYDRRLDKNMLSLLVAGAMDLVQTNTEPQNYPGAPFSYEYVINFVSKFSNNL